MDIATHEGKIAFCTMVIRGKKYIPGAICLAKSILYNAKKEGISRSSFDVICMIDDATEPWRTDLDIFDYVVSIKPISFPSNIAEWTKNGQQRYGSWISDSYTRAHFLSIDNLVNEQYTPPKPISYTRKIVIDADIFFVKWPAGLLTCRTPAAWFSYIGDERLHMPNKFPIKSLFPVDRKEDSLIPLETMRKVIAGNLGYRTYALSEPILIVDSNLGLSTADFVGFMVDLLQKYPNGYGHPHLISGFSEQAFAEYFVSKELPMYHVGVQYATMIWYPEMLKVEGLEPKDIVGIHVFGTKKPWGVLDDYKEFFNYTDADVKDVMSYDDTPLWLAYYKLKVAKDW